MPSRRTNVVRAGALVGGCLLLAALFIHLGPARILSLLASLGWNFLVVVFLFWAHELVRTLAIRSWLPADNRPPLGKLLLIRLLGEAAGALTRTGALAAEPVRAWLLANRSGRVVPGYSAAIGELMTNGATSAAVNVAVTGWALATADLKGPLAALAHVLCWGSLVYVAAVVGSVVSRGRILRACARAASMLPLVGRRLRLDPAKVSAIQQAIASAALTERPAALARAVALEIAAQAILVSEVYWTIRSMGLVVTGESALFIEVMTRALTIVEFVGATEVGFAVVFTWLGLPAAIGFSLSLVKTLRSLAAAGIGIALLRGGDRSRARAQRGPAAGLRRSILEHQVKGCLDGGLRDVGTRLTSEK